MKLLFQTSLLFTLAIAMLSACNTPQQRASASLDSKLDSVSYSIGYLQGSGMAQEGLTDLDYNNYLAGLQKALEGDDADIDNMAMQSVIQEYLSEVQLAESVRRSQEAEVNREEARQFLEENAQKDGITVTESGLQYRVIEEGTGDRPAATDEVEVHYRGTLVTGEEFDSSHSRDQTATFPLNRVISGWTEGVQLMREGATYEFFIPSELGYGDNPPPGSIIPPGAVLIFEIELIDIK
ncbi:MAG: FKBP-type peptidyl-prolyl cis-trans isomerase [Balneolaceae bacterium]|nr:MAG: FKBP-type peptidyl-prolyl cis-trans isomerase [Balneolaceae bacterium]